MGDRDQAIPQPHLLPTVNHLPMTVPCSHLSAVHMWILSWWLDHRNEARKLEMAHPPIKVSIVFIDIFSSFLRVKIT